MPLVFVHGVATRLGTSYHRQLQRRLPLTRSLLAPVAGAVFEAYWGDDGATFAWDHASLPGPWPAAGDSDEEFGPARVDPADEVLAGLLEPADDRENPLLAVVRRSPAAAVDLLWAYASEVTDDLEAVAGFVAWAVGSAPPGLSSCGSDADVLAVLLRSYPAPVPAVESFGGGELVGVLRTALGRMSRAATAGVVGRFRPGAHRKVSLFLGDVFAYLRQRERFGAGGAIAQIVASEIAEADAARSGPGDRVVVIAHSMGGNIVYDLLSHLRTDLRCDALVTVGTQVGLFAELDLLPAVAPPDDPRTGRVPALPGVRWLNVYDPQDPLAFLAARIFDGVTDREFSTGHSAVGAHSSYFTGPRFFELVADWLGD